MVGGITYRHFNTFMENFDRFEGDLSFKNTDTAPVNILLCIASASTRFSSFNFQKEYEYSILTLKNTKSMDPPRTASLCASRNIVNRFFKLSVSAIGS